MDTQAAAAAAAEVEEVPVGEPFFGMTAKRKPLLVFNGCARVHGRQERKGHHCLLVLREEERLQSALQDRRRPSHEDRQRTHAFP